MRSIHYDSYQFELKPTLFGYVLMYRESVPVDPPGCWDWTRWRRATWKEIALFTANKCDCK